MKSDNPKLEDVLNSLKQRGFSPSSRAMIASDWLKLHTEFIGDKNSDNYTTFHQKCENISSKFKQMVSNLESEKQFEDKYGYMLKNILLDGLSGVKFTDSQSDISSADIIPVLKSNVENIHSNRFGNLDLNLCMDMLSASTPTTRPDFKIIEQMEMEEEDLQIFLDKKSPKTVSQDNISLKDSLDILEKARKRSAIPLIHLDYLTANNPNAILDVAIGIEKTCDAFENLGIKEFGLGLIDLNIDLPYQRGNSGQMSSNFNPTQDSPIKTPTIAISNNPGWAYEEVIIHEALHAHDFLLGEFHKIKSKNTLLSDMIEEEFEKLHQSPLATAWEELLSSLENLESDKDLKVRKQMAREGILNRWTGFMDPKELDKVIAKWESAPGEMDEKEKDNIFLSQINSIMSSTPFKSSSSFRGAVVLSELKLLDKMDERPLFVSFTDNFDNTLQELDDDSLSESYGSGYFESVAEKMARSIQSSLDVLDDKPENPYAKRWLVYADTDLSDQITSLWKEFFNNEDVKSAYGILRQTSHDLKSLKSPPKSLAKRLKEFRQPEANDYSPPRAKAAL